MNVNISVAIITKNEVDNIGKCLEAAWKVADEIIIIDSFSTDGTQQLAQSLGARVIEHSFAGHIQQKNVAIDKAIYDHILALDADEVLSDQLIQSILAVKKKFTADAYKMNRLNNYCGQWIRHSGWYPDQKIRLFDRKKAKWGGENPHDSIILSPNSSLQHLEGDLLHYSYYSISDHVSRINSYTTIMAKSAFEKKKKATLLKIITRPNFKFFKCYFLKLGFLDGYYGFIIAVLGAYYNFLKYVKLRDLWKNTRTNNEKL
ncbi:MAG: glycosyltransferase family 2 protein [Bacteroidota bacterium]